MRRSRLYRGDIGRAQRGEPVAARSGARLYVFARTVRRYRWVTVAVAAVLISLGLGLGTAAWQARRAAIERDVARRDASREEAVRYQLTRLFHSAIEERGSQPATAKAMIDNSALRVLREYRSQPHSKGQIVLTLADLYMALQDLNGASGLLGELSSDQAGPDTDPSALADARQKLANNPGAARDTRSMPSSCCSRLKRSGISIRADMPRSGWKG